MNLLRHLIQSHKCEAREQEKSGDHQNVGNMNVCVKLCGFYLVYVDIAQHML